MRKTLILGLLLTSFLVPALPRAEAQSFSVEQQATIDELRQTLIDLLLQQIALLQTQIAQIISAQADTETAVKSVESKVDALTQPVLGSVDPAIVHTQEIALAKKSAQFTFDLSGLDEDGNIHFRASNYFEGEPLGVSFLFNEQPIQITVDERCDYTWGSLSIHDCHAQALIPAKKGDWVIAKVTYDGKSYEKGGIVD